MLNSRVKIFSGLGNDELFHEVCDYLGLPGGAIAHSKFADGELHCKIGESVRGCDVFIIQPTCCPVNENLMRLLIMIDALRRASAASITAVIPYMGYSRQEKNAGREPITAKLVANIITNAGADRVLTVDLHEPALQGFFDIPVDNMSAAKILTSFLAKRDLTNHVIVSPDTGGVLRARGFGRRLNLPMAIIDKRRPANNKAVVMNVVGEVKGMHAIVIDDIVDTAGTLAGVSESLIEKGALSVMCCCTHALLSDPASERISKSAIKEIIATNSVPVSSDKVKACRVTKLSLAPSLGEAIKRIYEKRSISDLFV